MSCRLSESIKIEDVNIDDLLKKLPFTKET